MCVFPSYNWTGREDSHSELFFLSSRSRGSKIICMFNTPNTFNPMTAFSSQEILRAALDFLFNYAGLPEAKKANKLLCVKRRITNISQHPELKIWQLVGNIIWIRIKFIHGGNLQDTKTDDNVIWKKKKLYRAFFVLRGDKTNLHSYWLNMYNVMFLRA